VGLDGGVPSPESGRLTRVARSGRESLAERYCRLGLALGRHLPGLVDAYYGPTELQAAAESGSPLSPLALASELRDLALRLAQGEPIDDGDWKDDPARRRWLLEQVEGLRTTARRLGGEPVGYVEEVRSCYGVEPRPVDPEEVEAAHQRLAEVFGPDDPGGRYRSWREAQAVPPERLQGLLATIAEDLRSRTDACFALPEGEQVELELTTNQPWSGFNYYLGGFRSRVAINCDLPVLSGSLGHLVAHEAYPGHHSEHCSKELRLWRRRHQVEETAFFVGTPECLLSEGLADYALELILGEGWPAWLAGHVEEAGLALDADVLAAVSGAAETLGRCRASAAWRLHVDGADPEQVALELARDTLGTRERAQKAVQFLTDPTWRAYISCYVEGMPLVRRWVGRSRERFARLLREQVAVSELAAR